MSTFDVLYPPTANHLFKNAAKGRVKTEEYKRWQSAAVAHITAQHPQRVSGKYALTVVATRPDNRRRDLMNLEKALSDALCKAGVVSDDSNAKRVVFEWSDADPVPGGALTVTVEAA